MTDDLRIVVLTYGEGGEYKGLLEALRRDGVRAGQVLIVHNPASPGERGPSIDGIETITTSHNLGYAAGMNIGIRRVLTGRPALVLVLTHDARLREGALATLLDAAAAHPDYAALGPVLVHAGTERAFSYGGLTSVDGEVVHRSEAAPGHDGLLDCDWIDGGTMLLRAGPLAELGGFDERLWSYFEDTDLCLRLRRAGQGVAVVLGALADQEPGRSKRLAPWAYLVTRNGLAYARSFAGARRAAKVGALRLRRASIEAVKALARRLRLRSGDPVESWALSVGTARGVLDFARGRWGPPPAGMPGGGDITNVQPPTVMTERPRILFLGPDVPGGMATSIAALLASPLGRRYRIDIVATHRGTDPLQRLAVFAAALLRLSCWSLGDRGRIVHVHSTVRGSMYRKAVCVLWAKALRRRVVLHMHSGPGDIATFRAALGGPKLAFLRRAFAAADRVLSVSEASAVALREAFGDRPVSVLPNPAPPRPAVDRSGRTAEPVVAFIGGFANPVKGGEILLEALARPEVAELRVVLAGPGEMPAAGAELVAARRGFEWRGWLEPEARDELLAGADVFVLPSTSEGLPMALLEAMSWGLAIVATAVGGVPDVATDGEDAIVVAPGEPASLAAGIAALAADRAHRARIGRAALSRAEELSPDRIADRLASVYDGLLEGPG